MSDNNIDIKKVNPDNDNQNENEREEVLKSAENTDNTDNTDNIEETSVKSELSEISDVNSAEENSSPEKAEAKHSPTHAHKKHRKLTKKQIEARKRAKLKKKRQKQMMTIGIIAACFVLCVVLIFAAVIVFGQDSKPVQADTSLPPETVIGTLEPLVDIGQAKVIVTPSPKPGQSQSTAIDLSEGAKKVKSSDANINLPGLSYGEMVYSAGTGSARLPVLENLFLYDMDEETETKLASATVKNGEIYETQVNQRWVVFVDTNQNGTNQICYIDRFRPKEDGTFEVYQLRSTKQALPKLRLYDDYLVWIEQTEEKTDDIWFFELAVGEDFAVTSLNDAATYGVSAPSIYGDEVIWAAPDPHQSEEERAVEEHSAIYLCQISQLAVDGYEYEYFCPEMYVHEPITNGDVWAWIDKNWAPGSSLYIKYRNGSNIIKVAEGVTGYALGDGILVYAQKSQIWAYFYEENIYAKLSDKDGGMQPIVNGRYAAWYSLSNSENDTIVYKEVLLPGESAPPAPTPKPTPSPTPPPEEIVITDAEDGDGTIPGQTPEPTPTP